MEDRSNGGCNWRCRWKSD